jgi:hypothetical protein
MGIFKKKVDPVSERDRALKSEIAALEAQIRKLSQKSDHEEPTPTPAPAPKLRSTARPHGAQATVDSPSTSAGESEPIFEEVSQGPLGPAPEQASTPQHYNDLGVRKYDLAAAFRRAQNHFKSKPVSNPKLVTYLAAGSIHGLRPLRYEKRIARNQVILLGLMLFFIIWGLLVYVRRH